MKDVIFEYVRERVTGKGKQIVGVIVGTVHEGMICTGFSKTNLACGDVFDKHYGLTLALDRARGVQPSPELPPQMINQYREFQIRCLRYFKQATVLSTKGAFVSSKQPTLEEALIEVMPPDLRNMLKLFGGASALRGVGFVV